MDEWVLQRLTEEGMKELEGQRKLEKYPRKSREEF